MAARPTRAIAGFFLALILSAAARGIPAAALEEDAYTLDHAGLLSEETCEQLLAYNMILEADCGGAHILTVTLDRLGEDPQTAAERLLHELDPRTGAEAGSALILYCADEAALYTAFGEAVAADPAMTAPLPNDPADDADRRIAAAAAALYGRYLTRFGITDAGGIGQSEVTVPLPAPETPAPAAGGAPVAYLGVVILAAAVWLVLASLRNVRRGVSGGDTPRKKP